MLHTGNSEPTLKCDALAFVLYVQPNVCVSVFDSVR